MGCESESGLIPNAGLGGRSLQVLGPTPEATMPKPYETQNPVPKYFVESLNMPSNQ